MLKALEIVRREAEESRQTLEKFFAANSEKIADAALKTAFSLANGGKLLICGNGGSAADAQHVAGEFVNRFLMDRPALPALSLVTDSSVITAIGNDAAFDQIFARQVEALGNPGDVLLGISTSGSSANVLNAMIVGRQKGLLNIGLCGMGGKIAEYADLLVTVPSTRTPHIQEAHLVAEHLFCQLTDYFMFENPEALNRMMRENCQDANL